MKKIILITLILCLQISILFAQTWQQLSDFPGNGRDDGTLFILGNKAYCGTGVLTGGTTTRDFYIFDFSNSSWTTGISMPRGTERQYACGFSHETKGFVFGGINTGLLNDLWSFDTLTQSWSQLTSMPATGRLGTASFKIDSLVYFLGGRTTNATPLSEVWTYNINTDTWTQKNDLPFGKRWIGSATAINGKGYFAFGKDENGSLHNELYEFDPTNDSWIQITTVPGADRYYSSLNAINNQLVVFAGIDSIGNYYNDLWVSDLQGLQWQQKSSLPSNPRKGGISFTNGIDLFYTTGINDQSIRIKETWKVVDVTSIHEFQNGDLISVYPNPASSIVFIDLKNTNSRKKFELLDVTGKKLLENSLPESHNQVSLTELAPGIYFYKASDKNFVVHSGKLIIVH